MNVVAYIDSMIVQFEFSNEISIFFIGLGWFSFHWAMVQLTRFKHTLIERGSVEKQTVVSTTNSRAKHVDETRPDSQKCSSLKQRVSEPLLDEN